MALFWISKYIKYYMVCVSGRTRVFHHDPLKAAFHGFQNCSIQKALNPKSSLSILISKAQEPISKNQVLSLEIEKIFGNFFGLLPRD